MLNITSLEKVSLAVCHILRMKKVFINIYPISLVCTKKDVSFKS